MLPWWGVIVNKDKGTSNSRYPNGQAQAPDCSKCWISVQAFLKQFGYVWSDMVINKHSSHTHLLFKLSVCMVQPIRMFWTADICKACKKYIYFEIWVKQSYPLRSVITYDNSNPNPTTHFGKEAIIQINFIYKAPNYNIHFKANIR